MSEHDARDLGVRVPLWIATFFNVRWTRELSSRERSVIRFEAEADAASVRLTTTSELWFSVEANGGYHEVQNGLVGSADELIQIARRLVFDIGSSGIAVVEAPTVDVTRRSVEVGPLKSAQIIEVLDSRGGQITQHWWGWRDR